MMDRLPIRKKVTCRSRLFHISSAICEKSDKLSSTLNVIFYRSYWREITCIISSIMQLSNICLHCFLFFFEVKIRSSITQIIHWIKKKVNWKLKVLTCETHDLDYQNFLNIYSMFITVEFRYKNDFWLKFICSIDYNSF